MAKLLSLAGPPLSTAPAEVPRSAGQLGEQLTQMLSCTNGFYAFESALHVRAAGSADNGLNLQEWNADGLWRNQYGPTLQGHLFFAEDLFGGQFSINGDHIFSFDPETGDASMFSSSLEEWADHILSDYEVLTGFPLAHEWQQIHGPLPAGSRLIPTQLFMLGGGFTIDNLQPLDAVQGMRFRADIATQVKHRPDGTSVTLKVVD